MAIVRLRQPLKRMANDEAEHRVDVETVGAALAQLEQRYAALSGWILDERGVLRRHINVYINGEAARPDSRVAADDHIDVLPAISGG